jgi:diguanylate cyclase (GGDEF)-like protein/PAS domain S-box-containing protein
MDEQLESALAAAGLGLWEIDLVHGKTTYSTTFKVLVRTAEPAFSRDFEVTLALHPDDRARVMAALDQAVRSGARFDERFRLRRGDQTYGWYHGSGARSPVGADSAEKFIGLVRSIDSEKVTGDELRLRESLWHFATEGAGDGFWDWDVERGTVTTSPTWKRMLGYGGEEIGDSFALFSAALHPEDRKATLAALDDYVAGIANAYDVVFRLRCKDGRYKWIASRGTAVGRDGSGKPTRIVGTHRDITTAKERELGLAANEKRLRLLLDLSNDWYWEQDADLRFVRVEGRGAEQAEIREYLAGIIGKTRWEAGVETSDPAELEGHRRLLEARQQFTDFTFMVNTPSGEQRWLQSSGVPVFSEEGRFNGYYGVGRDITERVASRRRIAELAYSDPLTRLPNRWLVTDRLQQAIAAAERAGHELALLFLDLDHFKMINDSLGHALGDHVLIEVGRRLRAVARASDSLARLGGDEFLLLMPRLASTHEAAEIARRVLDALAEPIREGQHELAVSASVGIALYPTDGRDPESLMRAADAAMYRAKDAGRAQFSFYSAQLSQELSRRLELTNKLRRALVQDEFVLHYQPQFDLASRNLTGVEALVRWQRSGDELTLPGMFIAESERSGVIHELGQQVFMEACRQLAAWMQAGLDIPRVSVNVSARQLRKNDFVERVAETLQRTGVPPPRMEIEITESVLLDPSPEVKHVIGGLKALGLKLCLDDFGTGYSSMTSLRQFPFETVKIDGGFVAGMIENGADQAVISAIVTLADNLGIATVAEGIETESQAALLTRMGCRQGQGYLWSRPQNPFALEAWLRRRRT